MMVDFSSIKLDWFVNYCKRYIWIIVMIFQHTSRVSNLFKQMRNVLRLIYICITRVLLLQVLFCMLYQRLTRWVFCQHRNIAMWSLILNMRGIVAINGIFSLKWRYYGLQDILWTIGYYSHFGIIPSYIPSINKHYRGLKQWICQYISLTKLCPYKIQSQ